MKDRMECEFIGLAVGGDFRCGSARRVVIQFLFGAALMLAQVFSSTAYADPPVQTGQSIQMPVSTIGSRSVVNLRQAGIVTGSAPLNIVSLGFTVNGHFEPLFTTLVQNQLCVDIGNTGYVAGGDDVFELSLGVRNRDGEVFMENLRVVDGPLAGPAENCDDGGAVPVAVIRPIGTMSGLLVVPDTDGLPGERAVLNGLSSTDADGTISLYEWQVFEDPTRSLYIQTTGSTVNLNLRDGRNEVLLRVEDNDRLSNGESIIVHVEAPASSATANARIAGGSRTIEDTDQLEGETVVLDGTQSFASESTITSYQWTEGESLLGSGATLSVRLSEGAHEVRLTVTDALGNTGTDLVTLTIGAAIRSQLSLLPNLTPRQRAMATVLDDVCGRLAGATTGQLTANQADLASRCDGILIDNTAGNQVAALDALQPTNFAGARTQTLLFAGFLNSSATDRLAALRGGAKGVSVTGFNLTIDGAYVPVAELAELATRMLGGGAAADGTTSSARLSERWGLWFRGNYSTGERETSKLTPGFDADQYALLAGLDYRVNSNIVVGGAAAYGKSALEFLPSNSDHLDTTTYALSFYGAAYAGDHFYFDAVLNAANSNYTADRSIQYNDGTGSVATIAQSDTDGLTLSGGLSLGYDFVLGAFTVTPNVGTHYISATIDRVVETGAGGLNLAYEDQQFSSLTANAGLRATLAWKHRWGVLLPHARADFVKEFRDDMEVFHVRFAADPNGDSAPPIVIPTDAPDTGYWRLAAGFSAQFRQGISGYVEYERFESFDLLRLQDVSLGLRFQRSF